MADDWTRKQEAKYSDPKRGFGEADKVVELKLKAYLKVCELARKGAKFLDLGANSGRVSFEMQKLGMSVLAVDLPAIISKIKYEVPKVAMDLEKDFPSGTWDLIFCRETIEHLRNYQEVCKRALDSLSPSGMMVITAPFDDRDNAQFCPEHVRIFKDKELDKMVASAGGVVLEALNERRQRVVVAKKGC